MKYERQVPTDQLDIVNKKLNVPTDPEELADLMKDFRQHLGKYPDVINFMRERRRYSYFDLTKYINSLYMSALETIYLLRDKSYVTVLCHRSGERIKICQTCRHYIMHSKECQDTIFSS